MKFVIDTHILLWWISDRKQLTTKILRALDRAYAATPIGLSSISLWEIAMLVELGRIKLNRPLREWLEAASAPPLVSVINITPAIAAEVATFPETFHRDPADRIIVATTRLHGATLITLDKRIVSAGLVATLSR
jgi:PIN domain nuclease of toxin-antitoxin system